MEKIISVDSKFRTLILTLEGRRFECYQAIGRQGELFADINGNKIHLLPAFLASKKSTEIDEKIAKTDQNEVIRAPLHGKIVNLKVSERKEVRKGEVLIILESMKMENNICATRSGVVQNFYVKSGQQVEKDTPLLLLGPIGTGQSILNEA